MVMVDLELGSSQTNECNICYEKCCDDNIMSLACCNDTKKICCKCLSFLTTPCPYCRNKIDKKCIPYLQLNSTTPHSYPQDGYSHLEMFIDHSYSFETFLEEERIINPFYMMTQED